MKGHVKLLQRFQLQLVANSWHASVPYRATLVLYLSAFLGTAAIAQPLTPIMSVTPQGLDFGSIPVGGFAEDSLFISNAIADPRSYLTITSVQVTGPRFGIRGALTLPVRIRGDGTRLPVLLRLTADSLGMAQGLCTIVGDGIGSPLVVPLRGVATGGGEETLQWSLRVSDGRAQLDLNRFAPRNDFPLDYVPIIRADDRSQVVNGRWDPDLRFEIAPQHINRDGTLRGLQLAFFPESQVAQRDLSSPFSILVTPNDPMKNAPERVGVDIHHIDLLEVPGQEIIGWQSLFQGSLSVVHTRFTTFLVATGQQEQPPSHYVHPTYEVSVSTPANRFAAVARDNDLRKLVIFDSRGEIIFEQHPTGYQYDQLHLSPSGRVLIYRRHVVGQAVETVAMDVETEISKALTLEDGIHYYSADGSRLLVIQSGFGMAFYYDILDPFEPRLLATYQADNLIITAAVCNDGSLVALQILNGDDPGNITNRVVVLNSSLREVAHPIRSSDQEDAEGLQWAGRYLFVGTQEHPLPAPIQRRTTTRIMVHDFRDQGHRR